MAYFSGVYLINPRNMSGVATFRTRRGEEYVSVDRQPLAAFLTGSGSVTAWAD